MLSFLPTAMVADVEPGLHAKAQGSCSDQQDHWKHTRVRASFDCFGTTLNAQPLKLAGKLLECASSSICCDQSVCDS